MENSELQETVNLVKLIQKLRARYKESRMGKDTHEQNEILDEIESDCIKHKIDTSIVYMGDDAFALMTDAIMQKFILN